MTNENAQLFDSTNQNPTTAEVTAKAMKATTKVETVITPETAVSVEPEYPVPNETPNTKKSHEVAKQPQQPNTPQLSPSERFTNLVMRELKEKAGGLEISDSQRKRIQNYFIKIDQMLKVNEIKRMAKQEQYREDIAYTWDNIDMQKLAYDVIPYSAIGLDPTLPNHINLIPYANKHKKKYDITFIEGYSGIELKAKKFGLDVPDFAIIELVFSNDEFQEIKRDMNNEIEHYHFKVTNSFDRGTLVGGFYYFVWKNDPTKNKIKVLNVKDIEKRRPDKASAEFWGGKKDVWENGKKTSVETDGWYEEMCWKTIARSAWNSIIIDAEKIDESYLLQLEKDNFKETKQQEVNKTIAQNTGMKTIVLDPQPEPKQNVLAENNTAKPDWM